MKDFAAQLVPRPRTPAWMMWATALLGASTLALLAASLWEQQRSQSLRELIGQRQRMQEAASKQAGSTAVPTYQHSAMAMLADRQWPWPLLRALESRDCPSTWVISLDYDAVSEVALVELDAADMKAVGQCMLGLKADSDPLSAGMVWRLVGAKQAPDHVVAQLEAKISRGGASAVRREPPQVAEAR